MARKSNEQQNFEYETNQEHELKSGTVSELISVLSGVGGDFIRVLRLADLDCQSR